MPVATTTEAGRQVVSPAAEKIMQNATAARAAKLAASKRAADTLTPLDTIGKAPLADVPDPPPAAESESVAFTRGPARRPVPQIADACLQWSTGLPTADKRVYAGWLIEAGKHADLDEAMALTSFQPIAIKHGGGNTVTHWALPTASLFVVADGVQSMAEMRDSADRYGIAFGWRVVEGRLQSVLRARVFVQELLSVGYTSPLLLSVKSTLTGDLLAALTRHYDTLDSINPIRAAAGKSPIAVPFYAVAVLVGAGSEVQRGSGQTKAMTPMVEVGKRDKDYITTHWCKREWVALIEALADQTVVWSRSESVKIAAGDPSEGYDAD